jgi:hypothetical protein
VTEGASRPPEATGDEHDEDDEVLLPTAEERKFVIEQLAALARTRGFTPIVTAPLVSADPRWFPDPWAGGEASMRRLLRRLLRYAGLPDARVEVTIHDEGTGGPATGSTPAIPVWLDAITEGVMRFSAVSSALRNPLVFVPASARAAAEAWRRHHGMPIGDDATAQRRLDVTAIYLGFGRLTVDAANRYHTIATANLRSRGSRSRLGVLSPQGLAFALAAVVVARGASAAERRSIAKALQPNPAAFFRAAVERLEQASPTLARQLGLPPKGTWPPPPSESVLTAPLPDDDDDAEVEDEDPDRHAEKGVVGMNAGKPVFRVQRSKAARLGKMLALPVITMGMLAARMQVGVDIPLWEFGAAAAVLGAVGLGVGRLLPDSRCSEPKCGADLPADATVCPRCGGDVMGVIGHPRERLAAEEALRRRPDAPASSGD